MFTMRNSFLVVLIVTATMPVFGVIKVTVVKSGNFKKTKADSSHSLNDQPIQKWGGFMISTNSLKAIDKVKRERKIKVQLHADMQDVTIGLKPLSVSLKKSSKKTAGFKKYVDTLDKKDVNEVLKMTQMLTNLRISDQTNTN